MLDRLQTKHVQGSSRSHQGVLIMAHRQYVWPLTLPLHWRGIPSLLIQTLKWPFANPPLAFSRGRLLPHDATIPTHEEDVASGQDAKGVYLRVEKRERDVAACSSICCPRCQSVSCYRSRRHGAIDFLHQCFGEFPWRCKLCGTRFYLRNRSRIAII